MARKIFQVYGNGREDTLLAMVAAVRAARGRAVEVGPLDERLLSAYGLVIGGQAEEVEPFMDELRAEAKSMKIQIEAVEFAGILE